MLCSLAYISRCHLRSYTFQKIRNPNSCRFVGRRRAFASKAKDSNKSLGIAFDVTDQNWNKLVVEESKKTPVILDCWANWCAPCRLLGPILETAVKEAGQDKVKMAKLDVDTNPDAVAYLNISAIPAVFAFSQGKIVDKFVGAMPKDLIVEFIERLIKTHYGSATPPPASAP
jgi:thioredoxin